MFQQLPDEIKATFEAHVQMHIMKMRGQVVTTDIAGLQMQAQSGMAPGGMGTMQMAPEQSGPPAG